MVSHKTGNYERGLAWRQPLSDQYYSVMRDTLEYDNIQMAGDKNAVQAEVSRLRKKIEPAGYDISTIRGQGYSFEKK